MQFDSEIRDLGPVAFPPFAGTRVMMMPFHMHDVAGSLPETLAPWWRVVVRIAELARERGVGYLTIDEAIVYPGETHRRPGLHVDGGFEYENGKLASWGGGPAPYAGTGGMFVCASHLGCRGWHKTFDGAPGRNGDCEHLRDQCGDEEAVSFDGGQLYWCGPTTVHESLPAAERMQRQFLRVSTPSDGPWHEGYTPNPLGVMPTGPILPPRTEFMNYRR